MTAPTIAVITPNILMGIGLRTILEKVIPNAEISVFGSFAEFNETDIPHYVHYFVAVQIFVHHSTFFLEHRQKTILLGNGRSPQIAGMHRIDIFSGEAKLICDLLHMRSEAPQHNLHTLPQTTVHSAELLSVRETEVLVLIARGLLNKQIAAQLHIGITTVISHRRNIMEKLCVKSTAGLIVYAVGMGYTDADEV